MLSYEELKSRLTDRIIVADGAMGTLLSERHVPLPYERANLTDPDAVFSAHREYVAAGAGMIETNTFGANRIKLGSYALDRSIREINCEAVRLARRAAGSDTLVAGAIGPCGRALAPSGAIHAREAWQAFAEQAAILLEEGADLILLETFHDLEELRTAHDAVRSLGDVPVIVQKVFVEDGATLSGGLPERFAVEVGAWSGVVAIGANCAIGPQRMVQIIRAMAAHTPVALSAMPTPGLPQRVGNEIRYAVTPEYFGKQAHLLVDAGASIVGGCCGTTPEHVAAIARALKDRQPADRGRATRTPVILPVAEAPLPASTSDYSELSRRLGKRYVTAVELDLPRGHDISKVIEGARALRESGVDVIDISDGARARLRMNAIAVAHLVQEHAKIEVMLHFACRDRNLLAVQADLLGAHALGLRNVLAVTGDPALIGDYPSATSVYDVDSVGLVRILRRFNEGIDLAGASIGQATAFTIAVAFDPLARDPAKELDRLERKAAEGAHVVYTQPIFDEQALETAARAAEHVRLPLLFGLLPLRSARHCEFMHNEVPGIRIPDEIRARMSELEEADARRYGLDVARGFLTLARNCTQGVYVMPPFGNHKTAQAVLKALE
ncbi:MAG: bifunctional homocysteine S-methyltransferase/methylenetetrahydrofolate reductase [Chthonomonadales bacterium]|nr:bifunctional homocysteine S-methyltransferase/methylenetetrahydrofolate reductase [Chthonomonadales bacterium]